MSNHKEGKATVQEGDVLWARPAARFAGSRPADHDRGLNEKLPDVRASLDVDLEYLGRASLLALFVVLQPGHALADAVQKKIPGQIRTKASARHVPDEVYAITQVPRTLTGKEMEVPERKLLPGAAPQKVASPDAMAQPASLAFFVRLARELDPS